MVSDASLALTLNI